MNSRLLLGCVLACCAGAFAIALGASGTAGAVVTAAIVLVTLLSGRSTSAATQAWRPVQLVTKAALFAVAVTAGAALVAYGLNPAEVDPPRASISTPEVGTPRTSAPGATMTPVPPSPSPEAPPSEVEEALSEVEPTPTDEPTPTEQPTPTEEPTKKPAEPRPTPSPEPTPEPTPPPTPSPSPSPSPSNGLCDGLLGILCP